MNVPSVYFTVQSLSRVRLSVTPWTAAHQASLSITSSWSLLKLMSTESVMPSNSLILCCSLLLPPSVFPSIRVFSSESVLHSHQVTQRQVNLLMLSKKHQLIILVPFCAQPLIHASLAYSPFSPHWPVGTSQRLQRSHQNTILASVSFCN